MEQPNAVICDFCGNAYTIAENEAEGNLPRTLVCGHIFCTSCLQSIECDNVVRCPDCEVESILPEEGVFGLQEDNRIIGLIYTASMNRMRRSDKSNSRRRIKAVSFDMNGSTKDLKQQADLEKIERAMDEALATAAEHLAKLEHLHQILTTGLAEQVKKERARLEIEICRGAIKAMYAIQKWRDVQLNQLSGLDAHFSSTHNEVCRVKERISMLKSTVQTAKKVRCVPFLEQYGNLDQILKTLQAPVDNRSFSMKCITMGCGMSVIFKSQFLNQSVDLFLKMDAGKPKNLSEVPLQQHCSNLALQLPRHGHVEPLASNYSHLTHGKAKSPLRTMSPGRKSCPSLSPTRHSNYYRCKTSSDNATPDVVLEEIIESAEQYVSPPTGPELAKDNRRSRRSRSCPLSGNKRNVTQWVVVTHVVNPTHFYVRYVAEKRESDILSREINNFCQLDTSCFSSVDKVQAGSVILAKGYEGLWCRTSVLEVFQNGQDNSVEVCPVNQLIGVCIFFIDYGFTKSIDIKRNVSSTESSVDSVNNHMRKTNPELVRFAPQAIRCSLKDLVPYDLTKGWSKEAQMEFCQVVGSAAVEMTSFGQDRDALLVDLNKAPVGQSRNMPISIREYLVFIEVARFYYPVKPSRRPLKYYPAVSPKIHVEYSALVTHINSPDDFYIQLQTDNMESLLLKAKLQECYNDKSGEEDLMVYCPVIGQPYVARFEDNMWYRAQVIGHPGGRNVEVRCIDYGHKTMVFVSDLRKMKDEFFSLPTLAIQCCLSDVLPLAGEKWSNACIKRFSCLAHNKFFTIIATEKSPKTKALPVKLLESSPTDSLTDIAEVLITEQLVCSKNGLKTNLTDVPASDSELWDLPLELSGLEPSDLSAPVLEFKPRLSLPGSLKEAKVRVSHITSPSSFYVQFIQNDSQLKRLSELLKECQLLEPQDVEWKPDMFCAAQVNQVWERGLICDEVSSGNVVEVMRCDHGSKVKLHVSNLRPLCASLGGSFALECSLVDIRPAGGQPTWTATACDFMRYCLTGASAQITIQELTDERPAAVTLMCTNKMGELVSVSDHLAHEGLALRERKPVELGVPGGKPNASDAQSSHTNIQAKTPKEETSPLPAYSSIPFIPRPTPRTTRPTEKVKTDLYKAPELPQLGHNHMTISAIKEDGHIYARTDTAGYHLEQLREKIQQSMKTLPNQKPYTWKTVQGCAVIGPDMLWYRGQLLEVLGGHVKVQYVDYGLVENIPVVHVYPRLLCEDIPQLCMACQLHGINPFGGSWHQDAVELLNEMLLYRRVDVNVVKLPTDPRRPLTVEIFLDGMNLSTILCHHKHALMDRTAQPAPPLPPPSILDIWDIDTRGLVGPREVMLGPVTEPSMPEVGQSLNVRVRHLQTPNELFLWWEDTAQIPVDGEFLDQHMTRINANVQNLLPLTNFPQDNGWLSGGPCLAEYIDGNFYRAKMLTIICADPVRILIQHVDFGSDDTVPTSKLRQMPAELLRFPAQVLKVRVTGFKAPSASTEDAVLPYSPEWSLKATLAMVELLHGDITAIVQNGDASSELSVLLYNQDGQSVFLPLLASGLAQLE
ncbi:RING finger protein 17 isoform X1 [Phyllopteryx taeniolatus]|uniref:RING finger protein 17 isoform X1 n=1 Tax=Phyllopteryx taeniolatus TaxID=161469 RepID=UPI002AD3102A|nr:RING finger protein 17 isoform X1 [Phyllopteryx taeniolatus]